MNNMEGPAFSEEELKELAIDLIREWWMTATQALVDKVGTGNALNLLKKGWIHHGIAGAHILAQSLSLDINDPRTIAYIEPIAKRVHTGGANSVEIREDGFYLVIDDCQTKGQCPVLCKCLCDIAINSLVQICDPDNEAVWVKCQANGDNVCRFAIKHRSAPNPSTLILNTIHHYDLPLDKQQWDFWCRASLGESWAIVSRAMVEGLGEEGTISLLIPYLHQSGLALGMRLMLNIKEGDSASKQLSDTIQMVQCSLGKKVNLSAEGEILVGIMNECPFSGSSPTICHQFEAFYDGLCEAINSDYKFKYDRMMTKGHETCHWVIKRKGQADPSSVEGKQGKKMTEEDPIKILKVRYARGEISKQEFEEMKRDVST